MRQMHNYFPRAAEMALWSRVLVVERDNLSLIPEACKFGESQTSAGVLWSPHMCSNTCKTHTHTHTHLKII